MKKFLLAACMMLVSTMSFAQKDAMAAGINLDFGFDHGYNNIGLGAKYQWEFVQNVRGELEFNYFFKKDYISQWNTALNFHYLFRIGQAKKFAIYPIVGFSVIGQKVDVLGNSTTQTDFGMNFGAGVEYPIADKVKINAEYKFQPIFSSGGGSRSLLAFGVCYMF